MYYDNSLHMSPKICQLFGTELQYMGALFLTEKMVYVKLLSSRLEVI